MVACPACFRAENQSVATLHVQNKGGQHKESPNTDIYKGKVTLKTVNTLYNNCDLAFEPGCDVATVFMFYTNDTQ